MEKKTKSTKITKKELTEKSRKKVTGGKKGVIAIFKDFSGLNHLEERKCSKEKTRNVAHPPISILK